MDLMCPELLTNEQLINHLQVMKIENLSSESRDALIDLFRKHIMPKPSRRKGQNEIDGKEMLTKRKRIVYEEQKSTSKIEAQISRISLKRPIEDQKTPSSTKRQKITWP